MNRILAATDFSVRSDRSLRRAAILAHQSGAELVLTHAIDDDQPARMIEAQRGAAADQLEEMARTVREADGVACRTHIALGPPFAALAEAAETLDADLIVVGPHRRQVLRDVFIGTTAERTLRTSRRPALMANGVPAGPYRRILAAAELSEGSLSTISEVERLGLGQSAELLVLHAFDPPVIVPAGLAKTSAAEEEEALADAAQEFDLRLLSLLARMNVDRMGRILRPVDGSVPGTILKTAEEEGADLIVVAQRPKSGAERLLLGSVSEAVLRDAHIDVLVVKSGPAEARAAAPA